MHSYSYGPKCTPALRHHPDPLFTRSLSFEGGTLLLWMDACDHTEVVIVN